LIKPYITSDTDKFPFRKSNVRVVIPLIEKDTEPVKINKIIQQRKIRKINEDVKKYLVRYCQAT
jgi:hypothetical protein